MAASVGGQSIIACRQKDGSLKAFYNVCKHRGHELLSGHGNTRRIICPYHAWSYDLDGKFLEARQSRFIENFEADDFCLDEVRVEVFCHFVFVNLDPMHRRWPSRVRGLQMRSCPMRLIWRR